jgi:fructosamine-3-kinase
VAAGRPPFTKSNPTSPRSYPAEAAGLRWLADAGPGAARVVEVLDVSEQAITLTRLEPSRPDRAAAAEFGRALARTHAAGAAAWGQPPDGWEGDGFIGRQVLSLRPEPRWGGFYADQRLRPYADAAHRGGTLSSRARDRVERVCERLRNGDFDDDSTPARIHGDLWSGNVVFTRDGVVLIDPAAHGGHGLTDLAMLALFGTPHLDAITAAYAAESGLDDDWTDLIELHQLHPLLVHAVTHGPSYGDAADRAARRFAG